MRDFYSLCGFADIHLAANLGHAIMNVIDPIQANPFAFFVQNNKVIIIRLLHLPFNKFTLSVKRFCQLSYSIPILLFGTDIIRKLSII